MISDKLIAGVLPANSFYWIPTLEIYRSGLWTPGEYQVYDCDDCIDYHNCTTQSFQSRWDETMDMIVDDERYDQIKRTVMLGFKAPLAARLQNNHIVMFDGHHRYAASVELDIEAVPVYIASQTTPATDLIAIDSNFWDQAGVDSPWLSVYDGYIQSGKLNVTQGPQATTQ